MRTKKPAGHGDKNHYENQWLDPVVLSQYKYWDEAENSRLRREKARRNARRAKHVEVDK